MTHLGKAAVHGKQYDGDASRDEQELIQRWRTPTCRGVPHHGNGDGNQAATEVILITCGAWVWMFKLELFESYNWIGRNNSMSMLIASIKTAPSTQSLVL